MRTRRHLRLAGVVLAAAALLLGPAGAGYADEAEDTGISVTIPDVDPTDDPTDEPTPNPPGKTPNPPGNGPGDGPSGGDDPSGGEGTGGSGGAGTGDTGGSGTGGGTGDTTPGAGTGDPADDGPDAPDGSDGSDGSDGGTDPEECEPAEPAVPQEPAADGDAATLDEDVRTAGEEVIVRATKFGEREKVQVVLFAEPQVVRTVRADAKGVVKAPVTIPEKTSAGPHALQLTSWCGQVALAEILVASPGDGATGAGIPPWAWWTGGGVGLVGLGAGGWYVFRLMQAPGAGLPVVGDAGVTA